MTVLMALCTASQVPGPERVRNVVVERVVEKIGMGFLWHVYRLSARHGAVAASAPALFFHLERGVCVLRCCWACARPAHRCAAAATLCAVYVDKVVEVTREIEVPREVIKEVIREVPVEVVREVIREVPVEVVKEKIVG